MFLLACPGVLLGTGMVALVARHADGHDDGSSCGSGYGDGDVRNAEHEQGDGDDMTTMSGPWKYISSMPQGGQRLMPSLCERELSPWFCFALVRTLSSEL